ncbi:HAD family hydrolase [Brachybacterium sp. AOP3-A1-3]|uniref:HAD family hydrolase n=1 Tax=Brachybacterium sp. AOP3-A1-3 TaxID=3457699 RepID=UPI00403450A9
MSPPNPKSPLGPTGAPAAPNRFTEAFGDWTPQAVVFDCDGLLLDTETVWQRAQDTVVGSRGVSLSAADETTLHGSTLEDAAALIAARAGQDPQDIDADLRREFDRELGAGIRLMPGAEEIVRLTGAKVPLGCASNSWLESLEEKLVLGGLREHFAVLEASDTVERAKPAPDMYAAAARALGAEPMVTLAFEDSGTGAQAARDAGLRLIVVPTPGHPVPSADLVLGDLTDPELAAWISTW